MYCCKDCVCSLCRELRSCTSPNNVVRTSKIKEAASRTPLSSIFGRFNENFILRRRVVNSLKTFQSKSPTMTGIYQNIASSEMEPHRPISTPSPTSVRQQTSARSSPIMETTNGQNVASNHKVIIYFGDSLGDRQINKHSLSGELTKKIVPITSLHLSQLDCKESNVNDDEDILANGLPPYIESICDGVINIKIEGNYRKASELVAWVSQPIRAALVENSMKEYQHTGVGSGDVEHGDDRIQYGAVTYEGDDDAMSATTAIVADSMKTSAIMPIIAANQIGSCDWSFVQEWRRRETGRRPNSIMPAVLEKLGTAHNNTMTNSSSPRVLPSPALVAIHSESPSLGSQSPVMNKSCNDKEFALRADRFSVSNANSTPIAANSHYDNYHAQKPLVKLQKPATIIANRTNNRTLPGNSGSKPSQPYWPITGPTKLTVQSLPVKSQPPMVIGSLTQQQLDVQQYTASRCCGTAYKTTGKVIVKPGNLSSLPNLAIPISQCNSHTSPPAPQKTCHNVSTRSHQHEFRALQCVQECPSSSDENRSSGHASMSDGHGSSSPGVGIELGPLPEDRLTASVTNRNIRPRGSTTHLRGRQRTTPAKSNCGTLEDVKLAIQQLTMRSQTSTSTYSSLSAGSESSEPAPRLGRYSSVETVNTNVTSADEFVWINSHNRLVELQHPPWSQNCIIRVINNGRCKEYAERVPFETAARLGYLLQRALVRIAREVQRLSTNFNLCSKQEVAAAFKIVLCPTLTDSCVKACLRAAAMFAVTGESALKQSKSARAGLQFSVGRFHRWMADARLGKFIHEYSAVYLCAGMENLLEEILLLNDIGPSDAVVQLTTEALDNAIAASGDLWSLLQPFAHLNAGRIATGVLTKPCWNSKTTFGSGSGHIGGDTALESCLLTTCVGSFAELKELIQRVQPLFAHTTLSNAALLALFYFMRCSQLEQSEVGSSAGSGSMCGLSQTNAIDNNQNLQELCYERAYVVLPPLMEWLRVASAHAEYRNAIIIDKDDIMQSGRLLLPGVDCPIRTISQDDELPTKKTHFPSHQGITSSITMSCITEDSMELGKRATIALAFKLMMTGRAELMAQASNLLPSTTRYDTINHTGLTALMIASIRNDDVAIQSLLDAGCDPNVEVPTIGHSHYPAIHPDTQHWTAVTFAASCANHMALRMLLERGGRVEGGARLNEDKLTLTPLQVAAAFGHTDIITLLLAHGANPFLSTKQKDTMCSAGSAQRGCYSAISVAAAHGQRSSLRKLLSHPVLPGSRDVLSLEEMLAEGDTGNGRSYAIGANTDKAASTVLDKPLTLSKMQIKCLQEAMYHSAENNHLDITIELRTLGVHWTLHCWMHALATAHELRLDAVIDQLLQDFLQVCPDDYSAQFTSECLPLLFNIFRYSKNEGTILLLADIFATCFGWDPIKPIKQSVLQPVSSSRIDPKFVNNAELSDVTFRVEGKIFYGHKIVLVTTSTRFQTMLTSNLGREGETPVVQINDIRYHIFQLIMQYLYSGGCTTLEVSQVDVLELMAAASFFQLEGLLRYTEARCSAMIDIENVVAMYIHAKVYHANKLLEYCQSFLLQNMVALLTYDDSVKRLLFAKKIPNHDVLSGLLQTLQHRVQQRKTNCAGNFRQYPNSR